MIKCTTEIKNKGKNSSILVTDKRLSDRKIKQFFSYKIENKSKYAEKYAHKTE